MNRWEKVVRLHRLLSASRYSIPKSVILRELECSEATFHRLRAFLADSLGAPLVFDEQYGGYRYEAGPRRFELPGLWFSHDEICALLCAEHAIESLQKGFFADLLTPLRSRMEPPLAAQNTDMAALYERIKIIPIQSRSVNESIFRTVAGAVVHGRRLCIRHAKISGESETVRTISPQTLVRYRDNWYVDAFCHLRRRLRTFALDRIEAAENAPGRCRRISREKLESFFARAYGIFTGPAPHTAEIVFRGIAGREVSRQQWHPSQKGEWLPGGAFRLFIPYGEDRELVMDILKWGENAEVTAPAGLRKKVRDILTRTLRNYKNST